MDAEVEGDCCSICIGEYKDPRILPCTHVFCLQCLCDYVADKKQINCPNCMTELEIPPKGVADLLKYVEETLKESPEPEVCNVCEKGIQASFQCFECDKNMCDACKKFHDVFSSQHQAHELQASDPQKNVCENHPEVVLQFYCKTCKCLICQQCIDNDHNSKHIVLGIEDYFTEIKNKYKDYQKKIDAKLQKISEDTDSFISKETKSVNDVMQRVGLLKLEADLKECKEKAYQRKKIYSEQDKILSKKLTAAIKHLDKPLNQSENIRELLDLSFKLESKIEANQTNIDKIGVEMGTLHVDVTMGRLFSFPCPSSRKVIFVGGIHWSISASPKNSRNNSVIIVTLKSFIKEEDKQLVHSVTTDLVFTVILDKKNSVVQKQSKTFSPHTYNNNDYYESNTSETSDKLKYELPHNKIYESLQIWFDIKEIKYNKNNLKRENLIVHNGQ